MPPIPVYPISDAVGGEPANHLPVDRCMATFQCRCDRTRRRSTKNTPSRMARLFASNGSQACIVSVSESVQPGLSLVSAVLPDLRWVSRALPHASCQMRQMRKTRSGRPGDGPSCKLVGGRRQRSVFGTTCRAGVFVSGPCLDSALGQVSL